MGPLTEKGMHSCCAHGISQSMPFDSNFKSAFSSLYVVGCTLRIHSGISIYPVFDGFLFKRDIHCQGREKVQGTRAHILLFPRDGKGDICHYFGGLFCVFLTTDRFAKQD